MIPAREVIYAFRQFYDRYDSKRNPSLDIRSECFHINQAIIKYIEAVIKLAETDAIKREELRVLEKKNVGLAIVKEQSNFNIYSFPKDHFTTLRRTIEVEKGNCGIKTIIPTIAQTDDLSYMLSNIYWKPDFAWEQSICDEGNEGLYIYHNNDFVIKKAIIDYYRHHITFDCPSLASNGKYLRGGDTDIVTEDTYLELPQNTLSKVIQIADIIAKSNQGDDRDLATRIRQIAST